MYAWLLLGIMFTIGNYQWEWEINLDKSYQKLVFV